MGYKVVDHIPGNLKSASFGWGEPLLVLEDEYGGQSVVVVDDHCLVLLNGSDKNEFKSVKHWHKEVVFALVALIQKRSLEGMINDPLRNLRESQEVKA